MLDKQGIIFDKSILKNQRHKVLRTTAIFDSVKEPQNTVYT